METSIKESTFNTFDTKEIVSHTIRQQPICVHDNVELEAQPLMCETPAVAEEPPRSVNNDNDEMEAQPLMCESPAVADERIDEVCIAFSGLNSSQHVDEVPLPLVENGVAPATDLSFNKSFGMEQNGPLQLLSQVSGSKAKDALPNPTPPLHNELLPSMASPAVSMAETNKPNEVIPVKQTATKMQLRGRPKRNTSPTVKPTVRANAKLVNPYLRYKRSSRAKMEVEDNKLVSFSYRRKNNCRLGYTTQVSIQFGDDSTEPTVTTNKKSKKRTEPKKKATKPAKRNKRIKSTTKRASVDNSSPHSDHQQPAIEEQSNTILAKRVSVTQTKEVVTIDTDNHRQQARIATNTNCVDTMEFHSRAPQTVNQNPHISTQSDVSSVRSFNTMRDKLRAEMYNNESSSDYTIPEECLQPVIKPRFAKPAKQKKKGKHLTNKPKQPTQERDKQFDVLIAGTPKAVPSIFPVEMQFAAHIETHQHESPDIFRSADCSAPNVSIPSIQILDQSSLSHVTQRTINHNMDSRPSVSFVSESLSPPRPPDYLLEELPTPPPSFCAPTVLSTKSPKSILKKTPVATWNRPKNVALNKRNALVDEPAIVTPKRSRTSELTAIQRTPHANMELLKNNWVLRNFVEAVDQPMDFVDDNLDGADVELSFNTMDTVSPIRAQIGAEPIEWQSDSEVNLDESTFTIERQSIKPKPQRKERASIGTRNVSFASPVDDYEAVSGELFE